MNLNVFFLHITLLTNTRAICITIGIVVKLTWGQATVAGQDALQGESLQDEPGLRS